jgi:thiamine-monophosphate kinase
LLPAPAACTAISTDTLVEGVHFFADVDPAALGHKALAVNLSDLAAMGAIPRFFTLALTIPAVDEIWLADFAQGLFALAERYQIELVGGDTTRGPRSITITVLGEVDAAMALRRDRAQAGDDIWVSGCLGGAALGLRQLLAGGTGAIIDPALRARLETPQPRIELGQRLMSVAHAAIDLSDGLVADLAHIAKQSSLSASLQWAKIPIHAALRNEEKLVQQACALTGGDDYELCFTAPTFQRDSIHRLAEGLGQTVTRVGSFAAGAAQVRVVDHDGTDLVFDCSGFDHFVNQP